MVDSEKIAQEIINGYDVEQYEDLLTGCLRVTKAILICSGRKEYIGTINKIMEDLQDESGC